MIHPRHLLENQQEKYDRRVSEKMKFHFWPKMNAMKRNWSDQDTSEEVKKKHRSDFSLLEPVLETKPVITSIEKLPNEVFYEIFDYLEGTDLYEAFNNLNSRFENLLNFSFFRTKIGDPLFLMRDTGPIKEIEIPYTHRTLSLQISCAWHMNEDSTFEISPCPINASFIHLQYLKIHFITSNALTLVLQQLIYLPRLICLSIIDFSTDSDIIDLYFQIFSLPVLEKIEIEMDSFDNDDVIDRVISTIPFSQSKTMKYVRASHQFSLDELFTLLSCTPSLHRLTCLEIVDTPMLEMFSVDYTISTLTSICIMEWSTSFTGFEVLLTKIAPNLEILRVNNFRCAACLDADRWQRIISENLRHLRILEFEYEEIVDEDFSVKIHHEWLNRFNTKFWSQRNWFVRVSIGSEIFAGVKICYSIKTIDSPLVPVTDMRKPMLIEPFPNILSDMHQMIIDDLPMYDDEIMYMELIGPLLLQLFITCLNITYYAIDPGALIDLLQHLPHLQSLVITSLEMIHSKHLSSEESRTFHLLSKSKSIDKVKIKQVSHLSEVQFILDLCYHVRYLEIEEIDPVDLQSLVRLILMKHSRCVSNLSYICCGTFCDDMNLLNKLKCMIEYEGLSNDYSIVQNSAKILLKWNTV